MLHPIVGQDLVNVLLANFDCLRAQIPEFCEGGCTSFVDEVHDLS